MSGTTVDSDGICAAGDRESDSRGISRMARSMRTQWWLESMAGRASRDLLRGALDRDDRKMPPLGVEVNREIEADSGLTADESLGRRAGRAPGPPGAGFESRHPAGDS